MKRSCTRCSRPFTPADLCRADSRAMEAERKALGGHGFRFLYYHCSVCDFNDVFVDVLPIDGESDWEFECRRAELEKVARRQRAADTEAVVVPVGRR